MWCSIVRRMNAATSRSTLGSSLLECAARAVLIGGMSLAKDMHTPIQHMPTRVFRNTAFGLSTPFSVQSPATNPRPRSSAIADVPMVFSDTSMRRRADEGPALVKRRPERISAATKYAPT